MNNKRTDYFNVAGHVFSLTMPDAPDFWLGLDNYYPFVCGESHALFNLEVRLVSAGALERIHADKPLQELVSGNADPASPRLDLYMRDGDWYVEMAPVQGVAPSAALIASRDFSHAVLSFSKDRLFSVNNSLMILYAFSTAALGTLEMHASVTVKDGRAYLFLGKSGTGKSTHSRMWMETIPDCELLNDDNPVVRVSEDGEVTVYGTPWSGKTPCYKNKSVPAGAFVLIRQYPENELSRMNLLESYGTLYVSSSGFKADEAMADGLHATLEKVVTSIPCYTMKCRPDSEAATVCYGGVAG